MSSVKQNHPRSKSETSGRVLGLERLESRQLLHADLLAFPPKFDLPDHNPTRSHEVAGNHFLDFRPREFSTAQQQLSRFVLTQFELGIRQIDESQIGSNQVFIQNIATSIISFDIVFQEYNDQPKVILESALTPSTKLPSAISSQSSIINLPSSLYDNESNSSVSASIVPPAYEGTVFSSFESSTNGPFRDTLQIADDVIYRWLEETGDLNLKHNELDRTLHELAQEQVLSRSQGLQSQSTWTGNEARIKHETPASEWLDQTNSILVTPATMTSAKPFAQTDVDTKLADATTAGWNIGISFFKAFETSEPAIEFFLAPAVASVEIAPVVPIRVIDGKVKQTESLTTDTPLSMGIAIAALTVWGIHRNRNTRKHKDHVYRVIRFRSASTSR